MAGPPDPPPRPAPRQRLGESRRTSPGSELTEDPVRHVRYQREYLGCGVFALLPR